MNDKQIHQLTGEIADFCKERLMSSVVKTRSSKSGLHTVLAAFIAVAIATSGGEQDKSRWTQV